MQRSLLGVCALLFAGCGYHLAGASNDPLGPFVVSGGETRTPHAGAMAAAEEGARVELSRQGALASERGGGGEGAGRATIVIEILRVDETSEAPSIQGGQAGQRPTSGGLVPLARALRITVVGRAFVQRDAAVARDTGDVRAAEIVARASDPTAAMLTRDVALERAARRLGERMVRRLLGFPEPSDPEER